MTAARAMPSCLVLKEVPRYRAHSVTTSAIIRSSVSFSVGMANRTLTVHLENGKKKFRECWLSREHLRWGMRRGNPIAKEKPRRSGAEFGGLTYEIIPRG
jgi:hypothetical protein